MLYGTAYFYHTYNPVLLLFTYIYRIRTSFKPLSNSLIYCFLQNLIQ